ncbi:MAG: IS30 family transposase [Candidatus Aureabacteria bacterium]|nr:IS30 family transposase [Candidatus Auribacterota bacterium]
MFSLVGRVQSKDAEGVSAMVADLFDSIPKKAQQTITFDNGKEFALHKQMAEATAMDVYFAHPYHSWERGTNENTNGLIRRLHPKRSSFATIGNPEPAGIDRYLNDRPRKCLGWHTPREVLHAFPGVAL